MFKFKDAFFGEQSVTKVAGLYVSHDGAESAVRHVLEDSALNASQLRVLGPPDSRNARGAIFSRAIEPEQRGIARTLVRTHLTMGIVGLLAGVVVFVALMVMGNAAIASTPGMSLVALAGLGVFFGLMVGGVLSLRPDHGRVVALVRRALKKGKWAVVAHPLDAKQTHEVVASLKAGSERVVRSF